MNELFEAFQHLLAKSWQFKYPVITMLVDSVTKNDVPSELSFKKDTHKQVIIRGAGECFSALIHKDLAGLIGYRNIFSFYYCRPDVPHDRYIEIMHVEKKS